MHPTPCALSPDAHDPDTMDAHASGTIDTCTWRFSPAAIQLFDAWLLGTAGFQGTARRPTSRPERLPASEADRQESQGDAGAEPADVDLVESDDEESGFHQVTGAKGCAEGHAMWKPKYGTSKMVGTFRTPLEAITRLRILALTLLLILTCMP